MVAVNQFAVQHSLITPVALAVGETPPAKIGKQRWMVMLSGVALVDLKGALANDWLRETAVIDLDLRPTLQRMILRHSIPEPAGNAHFAALQIEDLAPFASPSAVFNQPQSGQAGYAVDAWKPLLTTETDGVTGQTLPRIFRGLNVDLAVRNRGAVIHRVGYSVTLIGRIVFPKAPIFL